ncbi:vitellogenin receptor isoform X1 [Cherax quadricarinatus]|nr:low-density lipoprotein receptor-related protein 2-like isoform X1 [Cherax quadricarinatus]
MTVFLVWLLCLALPSLISGLNTTVVCDKMQMFQCKSGECITNFWHCDGTTDCPDNSDEDHCHEGEGDGCSSHQFACASGMCLPYSWRCDGEMDCPDSSDEADCVIARKCTDNQYECHNSQCISLNLLCDGMQDCVDGDDEKNCGKQGCQESINSFLCKSGGCVSTDKLCDSHNDCDDGSDEGDQCNETCVETKCIYQCFKTPVGPQCACPQGQHIDPLNSSNCLDVNECESDESVCDHFCTNNDGSYTCWCGEGYELQTDGVTCNTKKHERAFLLAAVDNGIRLFSLDHSSYTQVFIGDKVTVGVAYDPLDHVVYWSDLEGIYNIPVHPRQAPSVVVNEGIGRAESLAVDWMGRNLYIVDSVKHQILVCSLVGTACHVLISDQGGDPTTIQLDIKNRFMYWLDRSSSLLEQAGMDGSIRKVLVQERSGLLTGLALDVPAGRIYWMDELKGMIFTINTNGTDSKHLAEASISRPYSVAVWEEHLYWTDMKHRHIHSCLKRNGRKAHTVLKSSHEQFYSLSIYHPSMLYQGFNPCDNRCSYLCLLSPSSPSGYTCACPFGVMVLASDLHTCLDLKNVTRPVIVSDNQMYWFSPHKIGQNNLELWRNNLILHKIGDLDYDPAQDAVVVSDVLDNTIFSISITKNLSRPIVNNVARAVGIAVDWLRNNLYWVDGVKHGVEVFSTHKGFYRAEIVHDLDHPTDITLAPILGYLYISDAGNNPYILRCGLDGTVCVRIVDTGLAQPISIAFDRDPENQRLYWCDLHLGRIESVAMDGSDRHIIQDLLLEPVSLLVTHVHIIWTQRNLNNLFISSKMDNSTIQIKRLGSGALGSKERILKLGEVNWRMPLEALSSHPCAYDNGNCSQLCLGNGVNDKVCACVLGFELSADAITCVRSQCHSDQFLCHGTPSCIPAKWRCDGTPDCEGGGDERDCEAVAKNCDEFLFQCASGNCIDKTWRCDGVHDCSDGSDESPQYCQNVTCRDGQWQCRSGECIPQMWVCDGKAECPDSSDEINCTLTCPSHKFTCMDGTCIPILWQCDGGKDCKDGGDEENCPVTCQLGEFMCNNRKCVPLNVTCDGDFDCADGSDESLKKCSASLPNGAMACPSSHVVCAVNSLNLEPICIPRNAVCNGKQDCPQGDDEDCTCLEYEFHCSSTDRCIPLSRWVCDGVEDCQDGSDEGSDVGCTATLDTTVLSDNHLNKGETNAEKLCGKQQYLCGVGDCVDEKKLCDGTADCLDGSDEGSWCGSCRNNGGCQHKCHPGVMGPHCSCHPGYILAANGADCLDVKECEEEATCSHYCHELKGSHYCSCMPGYELRPDGRTCKPEAGEEVVVVVQPGLLMILSHNYQILHKVKIPQWMNIDSLEHNPLGNNFLFTDTSQGVIGTIDLQPGSNSIFNHKILISNRRKPQGLSFDPTTQNIYFSESFPGQQPLIPQDGAKLVKIGEQTDLKTVYSFILICSVANGLCSVIYRAYNEEIPSISVATSERLLFFCTNYLGHEDRSEILVTFLDGQNKKVLWTGKVVRCGSVAVDEVKERVYWTDIALNTIESVSWKGNKHRIVQENMVHSPISLSLSNDWVMWINLGGREIIHCDKTDGRSCQSKPFTLAAKVLVVVLPIMNIGKDACSSSVCQQLCTSYNNTAKCLCQVSYTESTDGDGKCVEVTSCGSNYCKSGGECEPHSSTDFICRCNVGVMGEQCEGEAEVVGATNNLLVLSLVLLVIVLAAIGFFWYRRNVRMFCKGKSESHNLDFQSANLTYGLGSDSAGNVSPAQSSKLVCGRCSSHHVLFNLQETNFGNSNYELEDNQEDNNLASAVVVSACSASVIGTISTPDQLDLNCVSLPVSHVLTPLSNGKENEGNSRVIPMNTASRKGPNFV